MKEKNTIQPEPTGSNALAPGSVRPDGVRQYSVSSLMGEAREAILLLDEQAYRLRITSNGKLILTK